MDGLLAGDAALATGAAGGIGLAVAAHWRAKVLADNNAEAGEATCHRAAAVSWARQSAQELARMIDSQRP